MSANKNKPIIVWLFCGCFLIYAMVVIGGLTRLTHSGLSMVDWNLFGSLPPSTEQGWNELFDKYKQYPEYQQINFDFSVKDFKSIFWWEYTHRMLGRFIGVVFLIPFIYFWIRKQISKELMPKLILLLVLGGFQGVLGWYMVQSGLNKNPHVSHYRLAAHLISAFAVFGFTFWTALSLKLKIENLKLEDKTKILNLKSQILNLKNWSISLFVIVIIQIIYGAFVAGLRAGYLCPTWPKMCDEWMHDSVFALQPAWKNFVEGAAGVQFVHRYVAYAVALLASIIWYKSLAMQLTSAQRKAVNALIIIVTCQFILGISTILYMNQYPVALGILHQTGAFFLFGTCLWLLNNLRTIRNETHLQL